MASLKTVNWRAQWTKDEQHVYCNPCTYTSMLTNKYCPSGDKCKYPAKAAPWNWHKDVVIECSLTYIMEKFGVIETFQCPACAIHCPSREALERHELACEPPTKKLDKKFLALLPTYEPMAQGPSALNTWHLQSSEYKRPSFSNWKQMACASEQRWVNERHAFRLAKREDYMKMRTERGHIFRYCKTCSESKANEGPNAIAHQHFSTFMDRCCSKPDQFGMFSCVNCKDARHYAVLANRYPLLVTSSFLNAWRVPFQSGSDKYEGDLIHVDEICIPGGRIENLHHAFRSEYANFKRPIDVLLAAGLNNFKNDEPDVIMAKIKAFKETVINREDGSTFAVCTIPFAPHLVDLNLKANSQFWNLGPKTRKMFNLNEMIKAENRVPVEFGKLTNPKKCGNAPRFHTWGLKSNKTETREQERESNREIETHKEGMDCLAKLKSCSGE